MLFLLSFYSASLCLEGASAAAFERCEEYESYAGFSAFPSKLCLGADDVADIALTEEYFVVTDPQGIIFDDESGPGNGPKELVADRQTIKGCRGRVLQRQQRQCDD
jgi:hypothetical protein